MRRTPSLSLALFGVLLAVACVPSAVLGDYGDICCDQLDCSGRCVTSGCDDYFDCRCRCTLSNGAIAGIVIATVVVLAVCIFLCRRRYVRRQVWLAQQPLMYAAVAAPAPPPTYYQAPVYQQPQNTGYQTPVYQGQAPQQQQGYPGTYAQPPPH